MELSKLYDPSVDLTPRSLGGAISGTCLRRIYPSLAVELSPTSYLEPRVDKCNLLRGGYSVSGISSLRSTGGGMYRDGGSGGGGNAVVTASMRAW
ncbi:hypothetical protein Tco_0875952 [Tanacetum coccineum]|uniref:Uncharacterized protein n=1 Tax=Tanacetum coccineum TaxID=301880 RepID=A0ABQ5BR95_9ASTR